MTEERHFCVVVTRPEAQAEPWAKQLSAQGFDCAKLNLLEILPVTSEEKIRAIKNKILDFDLYQKAIFVSQNAVEYAMQWLEDYWPQMPVGIEFFAVGATTAKKLSDYGLRVTDLAVAGKGGMTSEDLLGSPGLQNVDGQKIIIFRGCGGRGHMGEELRARGAWVDYCELYERHVPAGAAQQLQQLGEKINARAQRHLFTVHSGESLENLLQLLQTTPAIKEIIIHLPLLVPSQRIANNAEAMGFTEVLCAENATDEAMTRALRHYANGSIE
jgi:uroporphyrinogen-III synthase